MIAAVGNSATGPYQVMFAPYASRRGALEPRQLVDRAALDEILHELRVGEEEKQRAFTALTRENSADIVNLQLSPVELGRYWPAQFPLHAADVALHSNRIFRTSGASSFPPETRK